MLRKLNEGESWKVEEMQKEQLYFRVDGDKQPSEIVQPFKYALFFESAIDLMSFIDLKLNYEKKPLTSCLLVSMGGLKTNILQHTLEAFAGDLNPVLCVDNDIAGAEFINTVEGLKIRFKASLPKAEYKDWNDQLRGLKNG